MIVECSGLWFLFCDGFWLVLVVMLLLNVLGLIYISGDVVVSNEQVVLVLNEVLNKIK